MSDSLIPSFLMSDVSESLRLLTKIERCEQIAQVAHQNWATMSDLLRSLTKNERIALFLSESLIRSFFRKQTAIRSENRWANSQPCLFHSLFPLSFTFSIFLSYLNIYIFQSLFFYFSIHVLRLNVLFTHACSLLLSYHFMMLPFISVSFSVSLSLQVWLYLLVYLS